MTKLSKEELSFIRENRLPVPEGREFVGMSGAFAALWTPFRKDGSVNEAALEKEIEWCLGNGISGFYLTGGTGEGLELSEKERKLVMARAVKANGGRGKLIAQVGCLATRDAVTLAKYAEKVGIDWVSSTAPVYFGQNFDATYDHYRRIAGATSLPFMIYSFGQSIVPDRDARFFDIPNVKGMKYTNYQYWTVQALRRKIGKPVAFFAGADEQVLSALATGVFSGCIGMTDNMLPWLYSKICALAAADRFAEASELQDMSVRFVELILSKPNFSWPKAVMKYIGIDCGEGRAPAGRPLTAAERKELVSALDALGFMRKAR